MRDSKLVFGCLFRWFFMLFERLLDCITAVASNIGRKSACFTRTVSFSTLPQKVTKNSFSIQSDIKEIFQKNLKLHFPVVFIEFSEKISEKLFPLFIAKMCSKRTVQWTALLVQYRPLDPNLLFQTFPTFCYSNLSNIPWCVRKKRLLEKWKDLRETGVRDLWSHLMTVMTVGMHKLFSTKSLTVFQTWIIFGNT